MTRQLYWTPEKVAILKQCAANGMCPFEVGLFMGKSKTSITWQAARRGILLVNKGRPRMTEEEEDKIRELAATGLGWKAIGEKIGKSRRSVSSRARKLGIKFIGQRGLQLGHKFKRVEPEYKTRKCLMGEGHLFDARLDSDGNLMEYSCAEHRRAAARYDTTAMI